MNDSTKQCDELVSVSVTGLFGQHDHTINLQPSGMTLIHGPNGVGKTSLLKLIGNAIRMEVHELARVMFSSLELNFTRGQRLKIVSISPQTLQQNSLFEDDEPEVEHGTAKELRFEFCDKSGKVHEWVIEGGGTESDRSRLSQRIAYIRETRPWLTRINPDQWLDDRTGEVLSIQEVLEEKSILLTRKDRSQREEFVKRIPQIPIETIESQRLVLTKPIDTERPSHARPREHTNAVMFHAEQMRDQIRRIFHLSANVSQDLERSFAHRVLTSTDAIQQSEGDLRTTYESLLGTWKRIKDAGMLPDIDGRKLPRMYRYPQSQRLDQLTLPDTLDETQKRVLNFYIADTEQKLAPYQDLLGKVELFLSIVNSRFGYSGKELRCDASGGFRVLARSRHTVPLESLSSGEQHEIVLNYQLIFSANDGSLVLIDEPEISLHVDWQREFIDQILRIAEVRGHKFIVATHSPQIIDEHWENTQVLTGTVEIEGEGDADQ